MDATGFATKCNYPTRGLVALLSSDIKGNRATRIADFFKEVAEVEEAHEKRYLALLKNLKEGKVFKKDNVVRWKCCNCGYIHKGTEAPEECPACGFPQSYYKLMAENY